MKTKLFLGALIASASLLHTTPSDAGCALTVTFENKTGQALTVLELESQITGAPWASVLTGDFNVPANGSVSKAVELKLNCGPPHSLRAKFKQGANTGYETKGPILTAVDHKITITFK